MTIAKLFSIHKLYNYWAQANSVPGDFASCVPSSANDPGRLIDDPYLSLIPR